jgi:hypothetical protein
MTTATFEDTVTGVSRYDRQALLLFWTLRVGYGLLLGVSIALLEFAYYSPLVTPGAELALNSLVSILLSWSGEGVLLGVIVGLFETRKLPEPVDARTLALAVMIAATAGVAIWQVFVLSVLRAQFGFRVIHDYVSQPVETMAVGLYHGWLMLLFGGLAVAVKFSRQRQARMLAILRETELARERARRRLAETRLAALRAQIDPELLHQTLKDLEHLYEADPAEAARLLDDFVILLRAAVTTVRAAKSKEVPP